MRRFVIIGLLLGFAGTLAAAHLVPWVDPVRLPSQTTVVANGGRAERFVIRLPADRIHAAASEAIVQRATSAGVPTPFSDGSAKLPLLEHFK